MKTAYAAAHTADADAGARACVDQASIIAVADRRWDSTPWTS